MSRGSVGQRLKAAEAPEMIVPEQKPKAIEYTTNAAVVFAWFKQRMMIPVITPPRASMFNRPNLSARMPGIIRPKVEAAFRIASKYEANVASMPLDTA